MTENSTFYPAKAILFGEYAVIRGGAALAVPLPMFGGSWAFDGLEKQSSLPNFSRSDQMRAPGMDFKRFQAELKTGLCFQSNIPRGYGLGSSGAVTAAVYDRYCRVKEADLFRLKKKLGQLESFFHGRSSGLDPLVSFVQKNLLVRGEEVWEVTELPLAGSGFFLLDTGQRRQAKLLIDWFNERCRDPHFTRNLEDNLLVFNQLAIDSLLDGDADALFEQMHLISDFQFRHLPPMVPESVRTAWLDGLASDVFKLKLCGAGGGGFMLGFSKNWAATVERLAGFELIKL